MTLPVFPVSLDLVHLDAVVLGTLLLQRAQGSGGKSRAPELPLGELEVSLNMDLENVCISAFPGGGSREP